MKIDKAQILTTVILLLSFNVFGQKEINLANKYLNKEIKAVNREITLYEDHAVEMNAKNIDGLGILESIDFENGIIEIELLGENNPGRSFIGIAFNIQDNKTYEAIYFRPFNFVAEEQIRKDHMVQYIFHPEFTWSRLRDERTGEFEDEIPSPPDPDSWFKAIIKVSDRKVEVYMDNVSEPVLSVERLGSAKSKKIGIWTGYGSSGRYRNLMIRSE